MAVTLYGIPAACSLGIHAALIIAGIPFKFVLVNKEAGTTADGKVYKKDINFTGQVPTLVLEDGTIITQNQAIYWWIGQQTKKISYSEDTLEQIRLLEQFGWALDLDHGVVQYVYMGGSEAIWNRRMSELEHRLPASGWVNGGNEVGGIDLFLGVILNWNNVTKTKFTQYPKAHALCERVFALPAIKEALKTEGLA